MVQQEFQTAKWRHTGPHSLTSLDTSHGSWLYLWETRAKIIASIVFVFFVMSLQTIELVGIAFLLVILAAIFGKIQLSTLFRRMSWVLPFLVFLALPLLFGDGLNPDGQRIHFTGMLILKALTSVTVMIVMVITQPVERFFQGIANMGLPSYLVSILFLAVRYAMLFRDALIDIERALKSRGFLLRGNKQIFATMGEIIGGMFVNAFDRSETVYQAMVSRGFTGTLKLGQPMMIYKKDYAIGLLVIVTAFALVLIDRGVLFFG